MKLDDSYYADTYLETNTGLGFQGLIGKEWWVWPGWGPGRGGSVDGLVDEELGLLGRALERRLVLDPVRRNVQLRTRPRASGLGGMIGGEG